ncbi:MAG TPA: hydrogenase accessory protein HypB [Caldithrix abyssi]|uniref:Hydrogenase accessory protein HypB n=1 Tax=Caldithrix abyssi TaxID=187145 RepID=A0A7V5UEI3_CALAY|nr:hydrogenase accessory protein HypB [Caldithrix abyssi]
MCDTCGCGQSDPVMTILDEDGNSKQIGHEHEHDHHDHNHGADQHHSHEHSHGHDIEVEEDVLSRNNLLAERTRGFLEAKNVLALNLVSSPGSGKTTLLERTILDLKNEFPFAVIEGDQQTLNDAQRIQATGSKVIQINTGQGCHLDAHMVNHAVKSLNLKENSILLIENVGNLVCPALFDLGEQAKVVIISVTEGDDKPIKYPTMFQVSDLCVINKIDLLPYVDFDVQVMQDYARKVNPNIEFVQLSAKTGEGLDHWYAWLKRKKEQRNG